MSSVIATATAAASHEASSELQVPSQYRIVGVILAVGSGALIGSSFVFKKKGLLKSQEGSEAGVGVAYLKSPMWWFGMTLMILGEICNFAAYAFVEAIIVTPLGALSVVICAILSSIFLNEKLTFFGWIGCFQCIVGSVIIALNGPKEQSVSTIAEFKDLFLAPWFLAYAGVVIAASLVIIFYFAPRYGTKSMLWYIAVCSMIGGLSVSCTQGLGASIVTSIRGHNQFKNWFIYFLLGFVIITLLTEIYFLNMALALFNTAMVTPTYYVIFTFCTLVTSVILYQGLSATAIQIITVVLGFLVICSGITLLQMSKVDPTKLQNLDRKSTILLQAAREEVEKPEDPLNPARVDAEMTEEPGLDALRGTFGVAGTIVRARRRSTMDHEMDLGRQSSRRSNAPRMTDLQPNGFNSMHATEHGFLAPSAAALEKTASAPAQGSTGSSGKDSNGRFWHRRTGTGPRIQKLFLRPSSSNPGTIPSITVEGSDKPSPKSGFFGFRSSRGLSRGTAKDDVIHEVEGDGQEKELSMRVLLARQQALAQQLQQEDEPKTFPAEPKQDSPKVTFGPDNRPRVKKEDVTETIAQNTDDDAHRRSVEMSEKLAEQDTISPLASSYFPSESGTTDRGTITSDAPLLQPLPSSNTSAEDLTRNPARHSGTQTVFSPVILIGLAEGLPTSHHQHGETGSNQGRLSPASGMITELDVVDSPQSTPNLERSSPPDDPPYPPPTS
ncbi:hypothetical protein FRC03_008685 [Tulasnella sp. 419]|nr:hypothetical protein FRC03_008685 [Tulasnella sp. 419]